MSKTKVEVQAELEVLVEEMTAKRSAVNTALVGLDTVISDGHLAIEEIKEAIVAKEQDMQETADHTALTALIEEKTTLETRLATQALANGQLQKNYQVSTVEPLLVEVLDAHKVAQEKFGEFDRACVNEMTFAKSEQLSEEIRQYGNKLDTALADTIRNLTQLGFIKQGENFYKEHYLGKIPCSIQESTTKFSNDLSKVYKKYTAV